MRLLTPCRKILSALHSDDESNQKYMMIRRVFGIAWPQIASRQSICVARIGEVVYFSSSCRFSSMSRLRKWKFSCSSTSQIFFLITSGFVFFALDALEVLAQCSPASSAQYWLSPRSPTPRWSSSAILLAQLCRLTNTRPTATD